MSFFSTMSSVARDRSTAAFSYIQSSFNMSLFLLFAFAAYGANVNAADSEPSIKTSSGEQAVEAALHEVADGMRTRNNDKITSRHAYFTDDKSPDHYILFDVMPPLTDPGYANLFSKNAKFLDLTTGPIIMTWTDKRIVADENIATFSGILHVKFSYKDGRKIETEMRHTIVFKKIDGKFLIIHEHVSIPNDKVDMNNPGTSH